ncbi:MAG: asparagine synthase-related protein [Chloroflexota bacterium]
MAGIAGIALAGQGAQVQRMLQRMGHRGAQRAVFEGDMATLGMVWGSRDPVTPGHLERDGAAWDTPGHGHFAVAIAGHGVTLKRDPLGVVPLYYGRTLQGAVCFASEVKGLLEVAREVHELPPGHIFDGQQLQVYARLEKLPAADEDPQALADELRRRLEQAVAARVRPGEVGAWLSGGLDSSVLAALGSRQGGLFHTFTAGLAGSPDVIYARSAAETIGARHHERIVTPAELLQALPVVIYHLESFDAWLVRSSIMNYLVAGMAAEYVPAVLSGEGADELFAGYAYLKALDPAELEDELLNLTGRLHNTALQRVDRCAAAHGLQALVAFLDPLVVDFALRIPARYKLHRGVEKWILRRAAAGWLPEAILQRPKAKFWEGSGVGDLLADEAEAAVSDADFAIQRQLPNGWLLKSKEELLYYRMFCEHFGELNDLSWMGRSG